MLKVKFFMGGPEDINKEFERWQSQSSVIPPKFPEIKQIHHAVTTTFMPMPAISLPRSPGNIHGMEAGQLTTILSMMVIYEDIPDNPA